MVIFSLHKFNYARLILFTIINRTKIIVNKNKLSFMESLFFIGSIISVVGKTTVEIIELFECTQKVP